jgi:hypothetical protein
VEQEEYRMRPIDVCVCVKYMSLKIIIIHIYKKMLELTNERSFDNLFIGETKVEGPPAKL